MYPKAVDPVKAREFLEKRDAMVAKGQQPHRITEFSVGTNEDSLRADFEAHIEGRGMSNRLREEVTSYQLCALDDTWVEAVHRDVSLACKRATAY